MVTREERQYLRELAKKVQEYAHSERMEALRKQHWDLNTKTSGTRPVVRIESDAFQSEFIPKEDYRCTDPFAKRIEEYLLYRIYHQELVGDDQLVPKTYQMGWKVHVDSFGFEPTKTMSANTNGLELGYKMHYPLNVLGDDFYKLKPLSVEVDRPYTEQYRGVVEDTIGDILPVEMTGWPAIATFLTRNLLLLMSMEDFYFSFEDYPDELHRVMEYLLNNAFILMDYFEKERIMYVNNGETDLWNSTYPFTDQLPAPGYEGVARLKDMFLRTDSQETVSISPDTFIEFCLPYYKRLCEKGGLWYYGCCEPVDRLWKPALSTIPNIKKVSISPWCKEDVMGEALRNSGIVYSRHFAATHFGVGYELDRVGLEASIRKTMREAKGCQIEFIGRDIVTIEGNVGKLKEGVELIRRVIAEELGG